MGIRDGRDAVGKWIEAYQRASNSDDPDEISALFTEDAVYLTGPYDEPWRGRDEIVKQWIERGDSGLEWDFRYEIVAVEGDRAVIEAWTEYTSPQYKHSYSNVWVIELEGGRAKTFKEWWVEDPATRES